MCKHVAAALYGIGATGKQSEREIMEKDIFDIFGV